MSRLESKINNYITRLTVLEDKLKDHPDLYQTPDPSLLSLPDKVQHLFTRLTHCEQNHASVVTNFYNDKRDVHGDSFLHKFL